MADFTITKKLDLSDLLDELDAANQQAFVLERFDAFHDDDKKDVLTEMLDGMGDEEKIEIIEKAIDNLDWQNKMRLLNDLEESLSL